MRTANQSSGTHESSRKTKAAVPGVLTDGSHGRLTRESTRALRDDPALKHRMDPRAMDSGG